MGRYINLRNSGFASVRKGLYVDKSAKAIEKAHSAGTAPIYYNNEQALRSVIRLIEKYPHHTQRMLPYLREHSSAN